MNNALRSGRPLSPVHRAWITCLLFFFLATSAAAKVLPLEFDAGRNRLIAYMLSQQLPAQHFSHKSLDDSLSRNAYDLYLRQLDPRKRFLLKTDVEQLDAFADHIDDELRRGRMVLPDAGMQLLNERIRQVEKWIDEIMDKGFDPNHEEYLEVDPEKRSWARDLEALRDRWRRILKMQVLSTYLDLEEKAGKSGSMESSGEGGSVLGNGKRAEAGAIDSKLWDQAKAKVKKRNHIYLHRLLQETRQEHYNRYFDAVARAFDPHTTYMAPTSREDFDIHMSGSLEGIGALLREDDGHIKVVRIIPGSAAERQGQLQAEDIILSVAEKDGDPVDITDMRIRDAVSYIRGPKGTEVRLTVQKPDGRKVVIPIIRDVVQIEETYVKSTLLKDSKQDLVGYIRVPSFYRDFSATRNGGKGRNVTDDLRRELYKLKKEGISGLILDLRNNGGGALTDAVDISGLFLPGGPVVQVRNSQGMIRILEDEDINVAWDGPMIVLVNQFSASASEILAAALQDYGRALIIGGAHTHGKGVVQAIMDLNRNLPLLQLKKYEDLGALKVTIQKFYRINGKSTQLQGVVPDVVVPSALDYLKSGEKYMDYALPSDQVGNVDYRKWRGARFDVGRARSRGAAWVKKSAKFQAIREETEKARIRSEQTRVAVFLAGMKKERLELEQAREEARAAGLLDEDDGQEMTENKEEKIMAAKLEEDPFVQVALYLMEEKITESQTASAAR
ncbi:carboxy terminal-processing peptidase [Desulfolithobacter sp.]